MPNQELELAKPMLPAPDAPPSALSILSAAVSGGITKDNIEVVERLVALRRDEMQEHAKAEFAKAFFRLRRDLHQAEICADKCAKNDHGQVVYTYCSEEELSRVLEPFLFRHGFATMFGQRHEEGRVVAVVTLIHEAGHQEIREYGVRVGETNRMKGATAADAGSTTTAWRHLMIKMFGLKSLIREDSDARLEGGAITKEQATSLRNRVRATGSNEEAFLKYAGAKSYEEISETKYAVLDASLSRKEKT